MRKNSKIILDKKFNLIIVRWLGQFSSEIKETKKETNGSKSIVIFFQNPIDMVKSQF
jgi:hypothetical protein